MRILLAIALLISSLPVVPTPARAAATRPARFNAALALTPQETATPSPTPAPTPDAELEEAKRAALLAEEEKKRLVSEQAAAEARAARLKAILQPLGVPNNVTIPTGSVQTDAAGWAETQALSQEAARQITLHMYEHLCGSPAIDTIVIYNASDVAAMELYDSIIGQLDVLKGEFNQKHIEAVDMLKATNPTAKETVAGGFDPTADPSADGGLMTALAVPGAATGLIKSVAELINLFRTDTQFVNQSVTISEDTVVSYIADYLSVGTLMTKGKESGQCSNKFAIYYPLYMPPKPKSAAGKETCPNSRNVLREVELIGGLRRQAADDVSNIEKRIAQLEKLGTAVDERKKKTTAKAAKEKEKAEKGKKKKTNAKAIKALENEIKTLADEIAKQTKAIKENSGSNNPTDEELKNIEENAEKFKRWTEKLKELKTKTELLITSTEQMLTKLSTPEEGTKLTALARLRRAERLQCIIDTENTYTLRVNVTANGTTKIKKNLFVDAKVRHSARAGLVYQLFNNLGQVVKGSAMQCYIDYHSSQKVRDAVSGTGNAVVCRTDAERPPVPDTVAKKKKKDKDVGAQ